MAALARCCTLDVERAAKSLQHAKRPRIHTFIATSDIHLKYKLKKTQDQAFQDYDRFLTNWGVRRDLALEPTTAAVTVMRRTNPQLPRPFRTPLVPLIPILSVAASIWLMLNLQAVTWLRFVIWMAAGLVVYGLYSYRHSTLRRGGGRRPPTEQRPAGAKRPAGAQG